MSTLGRAAEAFLAGLAEIRSGVSKYPVWWALAQEEILDQHRKTTLGPLWLVLNYLLYVGTFVIILGDRSGMESFGQYAATGMFVWLLISEAMRAGVSLFKKEESYIKGTTLPLFVYVMRLTAQLSIRTAYAAIGWVGILLATGFPPVADFGLAILGLCLVLLLLPAAITLMALMGAFFPDMKFIIENLVRAGIFLTPVFWVASESHGLRRLLYHYDPFTYLLGIVREPIIDGVVSAQTAQICAAIFIVSWGLAIFLLGAARKKVIFVL